MQLKVFQTTDKDNRAPILGISSTIFGCFRPTWKPVRKIKGKKKEQQKNSCRVEWSGYTAESSKTNSRPRCLLEIESLRDCCRAYTSRHPRLLFVERQMENKKYISRFSRITRDSYERKLRFAPKRRRNRQLPPRHRAPWKFSEKKHHFWSERKTVLDVTLLLVFFARRVVWTTIVHEICMVRKDSHL